MLIFRDDTQSIFEASPLNAGLVKGHHFSGYHGNSVNIFILWLNCSALRRSILNGSLSCPNFHIRIAKIEKKRVEFKIQSKNVLN